jgi:acyl carrier protein
LPDYMVPANFVILDAMPLTPNGKLDRRALPPPKNDSAYAQNHSQEPPDSEAERKIAEVWQSALGITRIGRDDNFFDLGGDSLILIKVRGELQRIFGKKPAMVDLFKCTTIRALAHYFTDGAEDEGMAIQRESQNRMEVREETALRWRRLRQRLQIERQA